MTFSFISHRAELYLQGLKVCNNSIVLFESNSDLNSSLPWTRLKLFGHYIRLTEDVAKHRNIIHTIYIDIRISWTDNSIKPLPSFLPHGNVGSSLVHLS